MFFVLSKTLGMLLLPSNFLIGLGLVGALLLLTRFERVGRKLLVVCVLVLAICGFSPLGNFLMYPLESRFPPWNPARGTPDGIVVLGGSIDPELSAAHETTVLSASVDRLIAAAALAHHYPAARIVFAGGSANLVGDAAKEADYAISVFERLGIAKERLTIERLSRNTDENAVYAKEIAAPKKGERWLLVTSAFHMPRSVGVFRKAGFAVEAYPADWRTGGRSDLLTFSKLVLDGLQRTDVATREWIGLLAYHLTGKIDQLFPGPGGD